MPVAKRAGMLTARHSAIIKWAKSRHTPSVASRVSIAEVLLLDVFWVNAVRCNTQSRMPCTRL